jgi:hypothetical protein
MTHNANDLEFWSNRFHWCALAAGFLAARDGRLDDSLFVRQLAYGLFEQGAFREESTLSTGESTSIAA